MRKIYLVVCLISFFYSCSNSDLEDKIIGKWQIIETYQSNVLIDSNECLQYTYAEFKVDKILASGFINYDLTPVNCVQNTEFRLLKWKKVGNNLYETYDSLNELIFSAYIQGNNLITEIANSEYKFVYKNLQ